VGRQRFGPYADKLFKRIPDYRVRDGDIVHGRIELAQPPGHIIVSLSGKGIVTLDKYGFNPQDKGDFVIYSMKGQVLHRKERNELFDVEVRRNFVFGSGHVIWLDCAWVDENRGEVVIVARNDPEPPVPALVTVNMTSGEVRPGGVELIDRAIREHNANAITDALQLATQYRLEGSRQAWPEILSNQSMPLGVRLRTAVLLASFGDKRGADLVRTTALMNDGEVAPGPRYYAVEHLPDLLGDGAAPIICDCVRRSEYGGGVPEWDAMRKVSAEAAIPELRKLMERRESISSQLFATGCGSIWGPAAKALVPDLIRVLEREELVRVKGVLKLSTHEYAATTLARIGPDAKAALPVLSRLAQESAPGEWARVKDRQPPEIRRGRFSENVFIDAICHIRK
jgi:hypothetical protein